jgi:hypothetical protein
MVVVSDAFTQGIQKGKCHCTVDLLFDWFGISCMTTGNFCFYLQNRLIQTSQTGGQWYCDTSLLVFPDSNIYFYVITQQTNVMVSVLFHLSYDCYGAIKLSLKSYNYHAIF